MNKKTWGFWTSQHCPAGTDLHCFSQSLWLQLWKGNTTKKYAGNLSQRCLTLDPDPLPQLDLEAADLA